MLQLAKISFLLVVIMAEFTVFSFKEPESIQGWQGINDVVMGGASEGVASWEEGRLVFSGRVSFEHGGGFSSIRSSAGPHNLTGAEGLCLKVRGDGKRYKISLRVDPFFDGTAYQSAFTASPGKFQEIRLPFSDFVASYHGQRLTDAPPLDPAQIRSFGFVIADRQEGIFRLEIENIKAY